MEPMEYIALAGAAISVGQKLYTFVQNERQRLQQTGEWTDAQETAFEDLTKQRAAAAHWQPRS